MTNKIEEKTN